MQSVFAPANCNLLFLRLAWALLYILSTLLQLHKHAAKHLITALQLSLWLAFQKDKDLAADGTVAAPARITLSTTAR
jgi:hypothetical protein